jgi:hypothetical protein
MTERLVDVLNSSGAVLHTYPITLRESGIPPDDSAYQAKALEAERRADSSRTLSSPRRQPGRTWVAAVRWRPTAMTLRKIRKRSQVWTRLSGNGLICSGRRTDALTGVRKSNGIALSISTFESGPKLYGSRKEVPKGDRTNIGVGSSISRLSDTCRVRLTVSFPEPGGHVVEAATYRARSRFSVSTDLALLPLEETRTLLTSLTRTWSGW